MIEKPLLFKGPMVRALLRGTKDMTRRIVKTQPPDSTYKIATCMSTTGSKRDEGRHHWVKVEDDGYTVIDGAQPHFACPHPMGSRIWVKETFKRCIDDMGMPFTVYAADIVDRDEFPYALTSSLFMPRKYSRILLDVLAVRVERVQAITEEDAKREGVEPQVIAEGETGAGPCQQWSSYRSEFALLWDTIHAKDGHGWERNEFVWVYTLKRVEGEAR
jgi:hypothetical protein